LARLEFNGRTWDGGSRVSLDFSRDASGVYGVVYDVDGDGLRQLEIEYEHTSSILFPSPASIRTTKVELDTGNTLMVQVYLVQNVPLVNRTLPTPSYLQNMIDGYDQKGFDKLPLKDAILELSEILEKNRKFRESYRKMVREPNREVKLKW